MSAIKSKDQNAQARSKPPPLASWPWWKRLGLVILSLSIFGSLFGLLPFPSMLALAGAGLLILITAIVSVWVLPLSPWWFQVVYVNAWLLLMLGMGIRNWTAAIPTSWLWIAAIIGAYVAAWMLPIFKPELSVALAREQVSPRTRLGQGCLAIALIVAPIAAAIGPSLGLFGPRWGLRSEINIFIAATSTIVALGLSQYFAGLMWLQRPWVKPKP